MQNRLSKRNQYIVSARHMHGYHPDIMRELLGDSLGKRAEDAYQNCFLMHDISRRIESYFPDIKDSELVEKFKELYKHYLDNNSQAGSAVYYFTDTGHRLSNYHLENTIAMIAALPHVTVTQVALETKQCFIKEIFKVFPNIHVLILNLTLKLTFEDIRDYAAGKPNFKILYGPEISEECLSVLAQLKKIGVNCSPYAVTLKKQKRKLSQEGSAEIYTPEPESSPESAASPFSPASYFAATAANSSSQQPRKKHRLDPKKDDDGTISRSPSSAKRQTSSDLSDGESANIYPYPSPSPSPKKPLKRFHNNEALYQKILTTLNNHPNLVDPVNAASYRKDVIRELIGNQKDMRAIESYKNCFILRNVESKLIELFPDVSIHISFSIYFDQYLKAFSQAGTASVYILDLGSEYPSELLEIALKKISELPNITVTKLAIDDHEKHTDVLLKFYPKLQSIIVDRMINSASFNLIKQYVMNSRYGCNIMYGDNIKAPCLEHIIDLQMNGFLCLPFQITFDKPVLSNTLTLPPATMIASTAPSAAAAAAASSTSQLADNTEMKGVDASVSPAPVVCDETASYYLIEFLSRVNFYRMNCKDGLIALKKTLSVRGNNNLYQCWLMWKEDHYAFLKLDIINNKMVSLKVLSKDEYATHNDTYEIKNDASHFLQLDIDLQNSTIDIIQTKAAPLWDRNTILEFASYFNLLFNFDVKVAQTTVEQRCVAYPEHKIDKATFASQFNKYTPANISKRIQIIINSSRLLHTEHVFHLQWPTNSLGKNISLECRFYIAPHSYAQRANPAYDEKDETIISWVYHEKEMLKNYSEENHITGLKLEKGKGSNNPNKLKYYWLKVFCDKFEILKLWLTMDASMGELRDLHAPTKSKLLSGTDCLQVFDYLDSNFLKIKHTYLCDDAAFIYPTNKSHSETAQIPLRVIYTILYGETYYTKYSPGFKPLFSKNRDHAEASMKINSNPILFEQASKSFQTLTLLSLYEDHSRSYEEILTGCVKTLFLTSNEKKKLNHAEKNKTEILINLVKKYFPNGEAANSGACAAAAANSSSAMSSFSIWAEVDPVKNKLSQITLRELLQKIMHDSKKYGQGNLSQELKDFNELLKFPWGTINFQQTGNPFLKGTYYHTLYALVENGRYWERKGQIIQEPISAASEEGLSAAAASR